LTRDVGIQENGLALRAGRVGRRFMAAGGLPKDLQEIDLGDRLASEGNVQAG
jgi:hypothetical protein